MKTLISFKESLAVLNWGVFLFSTKNVINEYYFRKLE